VKQLLLGHLSARFKKSEEHLKEAKLIFKNVEVVEDGNEYQVI
jgi:ribonuclease BN (tRNA processing enzyme)